MTKSSVMKYYNTVLILLLLLFLQYVHYFIIRGLSMNDFYEEKDSW